MIFSIRQSLVTFLVLLQFIAPLVHAHTGEKILSQGLHIPGLEVYGQSAPHDAIVNSTLCKVSVFCNAVDGQIVGVNAGLSRAKDIAALPLYKIMADLDHSYYLPPYPPAVKSIVSVAINTPPTPVVRVVCSLVYSAHSPRAPPLHA